MSEKVIRVEDGASKKLNIVIADEDMAYLAALHVMLLQELDEKAQVHSITDREYFKAYFDMHPETDILVVSQKIPVSGYEYCDIGQIYVLTENESLPERKAEGVEYIYKYLCLTDIFREITGRDAAYVQISDQRKPGCRIVAVYSPEGGVGKTRVAMGIAAALSDKRKVLYVNAQPLQTFQYYLNDKSSINSESIYRQMMEPYEGIFEKLKPFLRQEYFTYLPAFKASLSSLNLNFEVYTQLVSEAAGSGEYDLIIADTGSSYDENTVSVLTMADKVLLVVDQTGKSVFDAILLEENMNWIDSEQYILICNNFRSDTDNAFLNQKAGKNLPAPEYIGHLQGKDAQSISGYARDPGILRISRLIF